MTTSKRIKLVLGTVLVMTLGLTAVSGHVMRPPQTDLNRAAFNVLSSHNFVPIDNPLPPMCGSAAIWESYDDHFIGPELTDEQFEKIVNQFRNGKRGSRTVRMSPGIGTNDEACFVKEKFEDGSIMEIQIWRKVIAVKPIPEGMESHIVVGLYPPNAPFSSASSGPASIFDSLSSSWNKYSQLLSTK